jgi:hypothetical protein
MADIIFEEHEARKGDVRLQMYRKRPASIEGAPVLFLVRGSSFSARSSYDLDVPGHPGHSLMEAFAGYGYDVWAVEPHRQQLRHCLRRRTGHGAGQCHLFRPIFSRITCRRVRQCLPGAGDKNSFRRPHLYRQGFADADQARGKNWKNGKTIRAGLWTTNTTVVSSAATSPA